MIPHPQTIFAVRELQRQDTLAEARRERRAEYAAGAPRSEAAGPRQRLGAALVAVGRRIEGAAPIAVDAPRALDPAR
jgi:hypothetical protein